MNLQVEPEPPTPHFLQSPTKALPQTLQNTKILNPKTPKPRTSVSPLNGSYADGVDVELILFSAEAGGGGVQGSSVC